MNKRILWSVLVFFILGLTAHGKSEDILKYYSVWKMNDLNKIQKEILIKEKQKIKEEKDEIELLFLYSSRSFFGKKLNETKKYAEYARILNQKYPNQPIILGHYANSILSVIRDDGKMQELDKLRQFKAGMKVYDDAIKGKFKDHFFLRFMRGATCFAVPSFLERIKTALEDFQWLTEFYENHKEDPIFKTEDGKEAGAFYYYRLGVIYQRMGQMDKAVYHWETAIRVGSGSVWEKEAKESIEITK